MSGRVGWSQVKSGQVEDFEVGDGGGGGGAEGTRGKVKGVVEQKTVVGEQGGREGGEGERERGLKET